jgi:hypothetical protein
VKEVVYALWLGCSFSHVMAEDWAAKGRSNKAFGWQIDAICAPRGLYVGWSICSCILGSVLAVLGWRYWAGGRPGGVGTVTRGRVEAVAVGSNCWADCGACAGGACTDGAYRDGAYGGGAYTDRACIDGACPGGACLGGACADGACVGRACAGGACAGGACIDGAYTGGACTGGACVDGACVGGACMGGACADGACVGGAVVVAGVGRLGRGSSFEACGLIAFS